MKKRICQLEITNYDFKLGRQSQGKATWQDVTNVVIFSSKRNAPFQGRRTKDTIIEGVTFWQPR
jgi:hypothetical protein